MPLKPQETVIVSLDGRDKKWLERAKAKIQTRREYDCVSIIVSAIVLSVSQNMAHSHCMWMALKSHRKTFLMEFRTGRNDCPFVRSMRQLHCSFWKIDIGSIQFPTTWSSTNGIAR
jgi:hypothetical protein